MQRRESRRRPLSSRRLGRQARSACTATARRISSSTSPRGSPPIRSGDPAPAASLTLVKKGRTGGGGGSVRVEVARLLGLDPTIVSAVALNVTATDSVGGGFVTAYPCGEEVPLASNVNTVPGAATANAVLAPLSLEGDVCLYTATTSHLVVDASAWLAPGAMRGVVPVRLLDTRTGAPGREARLVAAGEVLRLGVSAELGLDGDAVEAVALNATITEPVAAGYLTVYPCGEVPWFSNVNAEPGQTVANAVLAPVSVGGDVCVVSSVDTHLVIDVAGWVPA